jgi:hypothetical protein
MKEKADKLRIFVTKQAIGTLLGIIQVPRQKRIDCIARLFLNVFSSCTIDPSRGHSPSATSLGPKPTSTIRLKRRSRREQMGKVSFKRATACTINLIDPEYNKGREI